LKSIFTDKSKEPSTGQLEKDLGDSYHLWTTLVEFTKQLYPQLIERWHYSGDKFGWSFRLCDKKRVIVYLLPRHKFFKVAFVFSEKATDQVLESNVPAKMKKELINAKAYAEGRGIRIEVRDKSTIEEIMKLIMIKINNRRSKKSLS
jgi:hypothetical protein